MLPANTTPMSELAQQRSLIINAWSYLSKTSAAKCAGMLMACATTHRYTNRTSPIKGATLDSWIKEGNAPLWACKAALVLCLSEKWQPSNTTEWAVFSYLYIRLEDSVHSLEDITHSLPSHIPTDIATGWICAAIEEQSHFNTKMQS